jgi:uncharacterized protein YjiS (DUF1127 family)
MSDRTFSNVFAPFAPGWRARKTTGGQARGNARGLGHGPGRPVVVDPYAAPGPRGVPGAGAARRTDLWAMLRAAWRRHRTRARLADLDARALKDIGISFAEAEAEANKPFWML